MGAALLTVQEGAMSYSPFGHSQSSTSQVGVSDGWSGPQSGAAFCCSSYGHRFLASTGTELNAALGMYSPPYGAAGTASQSLASYLTYSPPSVLHSTLNPTYDIKDVALHSGIARSATYYPYDHSLGQYQYDRHSGVILSRSAPRKNATRETTGTLKAWLFEHRKNPYPTKGEKIMLAIITKMTLTQVSTWFANARRRLKKENKMTWSAKNKAGETRKEDLFEKKDHGCVNKVIFNSLHVTSSTDREGKSLRLNDPDDVNDACGRMESDSEKRSRVKPESRPTPAGVPSKWDPNGRLHLPSNLHTAAPSNKSVGAPASEFLEATRATMSSAMVPTEAGPLSHFGTSEKSRLWSLAQTAATAGLLLGPPDHREPRTEITAVGCQLLTAKLQPVGSRQGEELGGLRDTTNLSNIEDSFHGGTPLSHREVHGTSTFTHKPLQLHFPSYPVLTDTCSYTSTEGFTSGEQSEEMTSEQEDKVTAFRPVMKRFVDYQSGNVEDFT